MKLEVKQMLEFLRNHTPLIIDLEKNDIIYDTKSMYYKIYKYILEKER